jgi:hypothetical protein
LENCRVKRGNLQRECREKERIIAVKQRIIGPDCPINAERMQRECRENAKRMQRETGKISVPVLTINR